MGGMKAHVTVMYLSVAVGMMRRFERCVFVSHG